MPMPYKDPDKQREAMKIIMRDRRAEERAETETEEKQRKLALIEEFLVYELAWMGPHEEFLAEPNKTVKPAVTNPESVWADVETTTKTHYPPGVTLTTKKTEHTLVKSGPENRDIPIGSITVSESVPKGWLPMIERIQSRLVCEKVSASSIYLKRQIEVYLPKDHRDLLAARNYNRMMFLAKDLPSLVRKKGSDLAEYEKLLKAYKAAQMEFEDYSNFGLRAGYKVREIVDKASLIPLAWFTYGFLPSETAPIIVEQQLRDLKMQQQANEAAGMEIFPGLHEDDKRHFEAYDKALREKYGRR